MPPGGLRPSCHKDWNFCHIWLRRLAEQAKAAWCYCCTDNKFYLSIFPSVGMLFLFYSRNLEAGQKFTHMLSGAVDWIAYFYQQIRLPQCSSRAALCFILKQAAVGLIPIYSHRCRRRSALRATSVYPRVLRVGKLIGFDGSDLSLVAKWGFCWRGHKAQTRRGAAEEACA